MAMHVSVIIPVYNAAAYVEEAAESALAQKQTGEVLLVEDGSPDDSLAVCRRIAERHSAVHLLTHPGQTNRGAASSRNLGIAKAGCDYVAFLDADDLYLPNRFDVTARVFGSDSCAEGVYEAIGTRFETEECERWWRESGCPLLTTIQAGIRPEQVFENQLPIGQAGYCSLVGITVRKTVFSKTGLFDEKLRLHQDSSFFMKLAACCRLREGRVDQPIAMRRVHPQNRITAPRSGREIWEGRCQMWLSVYRWARRQKSEPSRRRLVVARMLWECSSVGLDSSKSALRSTLLRRCAGIIFREPALVGERTFVRGIVKHLAIAEAT